MSKDFKEFRNLINEEEIVAKIIDKSPLSKGTILHFDTSPEGMEKYHKELVTSIVNAAMIATVDFLQVYHQWVNSDENKE